MSFDPITAGLDVLGKILDRVLPNKVEADKAKAELLSMQVQGELNQLMGQLEINKEEAKSANWFVAGARPFILWICGTAFLYSSLVEPMARFVATVMFHYTGTYPSIDTELTMQVMMGILGLGAFRTFEKYKGVEPNR